MRTIKFRAKRIDNGKWAYGGLIEADDYCIIDQRNELYVERDYQFRGDWIKSFSAFGHSVGLTEPTVT